MSDIIRKPVHCVIEDFEFRAFQAVIEVSSFVNIGIICFIFAQFFKFTEVLFGEVLLGFFSKPFKFYRFFCCTLFELELTHYLHNSLNSQLLFTRSLFTST